MLGVRAIHFDSLEPPMFKHRLVSTLAALALATTAACGASSSARPTAVAPATDARKVDVKGDIDFQNDRLHRDPVADAADAFSRGDAAGARAMMEKLVAAVPAGWKPVTRTQDGIAIAAWRMSDLWLYAAFQPDALQGSIVWVGPSYARAYWLLGFMAIEDKDFPRAAKMLDAGLALERHPRLLIERAIVAGQLKDHAGGLALYVEASDAMMATDQEKAVAWRGRGVQLIDLGRLDEAEQALRHSLELEPGNEIAAGELRYIDQLRTNQAQAADANIVTR